MYAEIKNFLLFSFMFKQPQNMNHLIATKISRPRVYIFTLFRHLLIYFLSSNSTVLQVYIFIYECTCKDESLILLIAVYCHSP